MMRRPLISGLLLTVMVQLFAVALPHTHHHEISCNALDHGSTSQQPATFGEVHEIRDAAPCLACKLTAPHLSLGDPAPSPEAPTRDGHLEYRQAVSPTLEGRHDHASRDPPSLSV